MVFERQWAQFTGAGFVGSGKASKRYATANGGMPSTRSVA
jgi:hypothetical protein